MRRGGKLLSGLVLAAVLAGCSPGKAALPTTGAEEEGPVQTADENIGAEGTTSVDGMELEGLVTERYRLEYDSPDRYRLDISLPLLREDLPGAAEINGQIGVDYGEYLALEPEKFYYEDARFSYPMIRIHYEQYRFGDLLELVVRYEAYSLYGSGPAAFNRIYCYDLGREEVSALSRLMEELEISEEDVVKTYIKISGIEEEESDRVSFAGDLVHFFYLDENGDIVIEANQ